MPVGEWNASLGREVTTPPPPSPRSAGPLLASLLELFSKLDQTILTKCSVKVVLARSEDIFEV